MFTLRARTADPPRDRIVRSRAFRRLQKKTQVLHAPANDHVSTRLTHTLEVASIARAIASRLSPPTSLDLEQLEAIALAHDVGHPPFGHAGEKILARLAADAGLGGFHHAAFGARLLSVLERDDDGAPVVSDADVLDGVLAHSKGKSGTIFARGALKQRRMEALIVRAADLYAYAAGDFADAIRLGVLDASALPAEVVRTLGASPSEIRRQLVDRTVATPDGCVTIDDEGAAALESLRALLYERVYESPLTAPQDRLAERTLSGVFRTLLAAPSRLEAIGWRRRDDGVAFAPRDVLDAIACMTDVFALDAARGL